MVEMSLKQARSEYGDEVVSQSDGRWPTAIVDRRGQKVAAFAGLDLLGEPTFRLEDWGGLEYLPEGPFAAVYS